MIASIPSPSFNSIEIGPLSLNLYGLMIALGVIAAVWLFGRRIQERGIGTPDDASAIGLVAVLAGVVGARLYHVITDWDRFQHDLAKIPAIWEGGLGIPGGLILGIPVGLWMAHRRGLPLATTATCAAPAIALAQAIGRWGNYFNQELYGRATDLPWALEIDPAHLLPGYPVGTTFHPTFLYESLWSLGLVLVLLWIDRRGWLRDGSLMAVYVIGYGIGRFWVEGLRIDRADELLGLRWNQWMALAAVVGGAVVLWWWEHRPLPPEPAAEDGAGSADADGVPSEAPAMTGEDGGHADGPGSAAEETFADQDRSADEERFADEGRSADGEPFADEDRSADEAVADEDRSAAGETFADDDRSADEAVAGDGVEEVDR